MREGAGCRSRRVGGIRGPARHLVLALMLAPLPALAASRALAQAPEVAPAGDACARGGVPALTLSHPFLATRDTVTLLHGELVANAADGRGSLTIEYLSRAAPADTARLRREAESLVQALTPLAGGTPYGVLILRACRLEPGRPAARPVGSFTFERAAEDAWRAVERSERGRPRTP